MAMRRRCNRKGNSGFSAASTAEEVTEGIDGTGLTAIVTGSFSSSYYFVNLFAYSFFRLSVRRSLVRICGRQSYDFLCFLFVFFFFFATFCLATLTVLGGMRWERW